ncbi:formyl transferase [Paraglaciecola sp. 20A4]|uniref:formyl transferase n=1 Tax=Paraglaciecola sp. 20A4 TaxID=2687288 RepID=UPI001408C41D|nr:formyl transferase [Paraglaciecola sp. 20A4]
MNIVILANRDLASNYALNLLLPQLSKHSVSLFLSAKVGGNSSKPPELVSLKFFEQTLFNELLSPLFEQLPSHKGFMSFAQMNRILVQPVEALNVINSPHGLAKISALQPELILSIRYGSILKQEILSLPRLGVLNLHSGLLPDYRGVMATFWAMLHGQNKIGTTLHFIDDASIDTGQIVAQSHLEVEPDKSYLWHVLQLYVEGIALLSEAVSTLALGKSLSLTKQIGGQYFSFPDSQDLTKFKDQGLSLVNEDELTTFIHQHYC